MAPYNGGGDMIPGEGAVSDALDGLVSFPEGAVPCGSGFSPEEQVVLASVNQKVAAGQSLAEVMDYLFETTRGIFPCDRLGLALVEEDGRLVSHWVRAEYEKLLLGSGYAEDLRGSTLEAVLAHGRPRIITDLAAYLERTPASRSTRLLVEEGVRSSLTCPLVVEGRRVGVLFRSSRRPGAYDRHQVVLHQAVAERLGQAVEKVWLVERAQEATRAYMEMLAFVSHELKSPLASLVMDSRVLLGGYAGDLDEVARSKVAGIARKAEGLINLVREYLDLARTEGGTLHATLAPGVDLAAEVVEPALEVVAPQVEAKGMRVERVFPAEPVVIRADRELLRIVAVNLASNAVKYGREHGLIRITVAADGDGAMVVVWNEGPGFPEEQRSRLFRRFSRLQTPELLSRPGTGVGLYTSWKVVHLHGGRMDAASREGEWAEFRVRLPLDGPEAPEQA